MKITFFLISIFGLLQIGCMAQQNTNNTKMNDSLSSKKNKVSKIELTEQTRGRNLLYTIQESSVLISTNGREMTNEIKPEDWSLLSSILNKMDIQKINQYPAPSEKRYYDGAASSQINISIGKEILSSNSFDAGNPPTELSELYLAIKKTTGKNTNRSSTMQPKR